MLGFGLQLLCVSTTDEVLRLIWERTWVLSIRAFQLSVSRHQPCGVRALALSETSKLPGAGWHGAREHSWQHSVWKAAKAMGTRGASRSLWRTLASKPGLQRSTFLRLGYTGSEPSPAYCLFSIEKEGTEGCTFLSQWGQVPSEMSHLQSELLFREQKSRTWCSRVTHLLLDPKKSQLLFWKLTRLQQKDWGILPSTAQEWAAQTELSSERSSSGFEPPQATTFLPFPRGGNTPQHKRAYLLTSLPLPMCSTGSGLGCRVLQRARLC